MWHEARKHEKKIRGMMIDYRRRAERRREFYESIRRDPASFLQIHGQQMKIHIDPVISQTAESSLMPWMGDTKNMIDRFDVRAHLDYIPTPTSVSNNESDYTLTDEQEARLNYERFRNLVQNDFLSITEQKYLNQIYLEERCGQNNSRQQSKIEIKKKLAEKRAAIGYNYEDSNTVVNSVDNEDSVSDSDCDEEDFEDLDTTVHIENLNDEMRNRIGTIASKFGMKDDYFIKLLEADKEESEKLRIAKEIETEKSMFVGRKSRRERKDLKQQRLLILRSINNDDTSLEPFGNDTIIKSTGNDASSDSSDDDEDDNNSKSEVEEGKIEFITCFGNSSDEEQKITSKPKNKKEKLKKNKIKEAVKEFKTKLLKTKNSKEESNNCPMFGPLLPCQKSIDDVDDDANIKFNAFNNNQTRQRRYRYLRKSDDDDDRKHSPVRVRRSPSVRRHRRSSSEYSSRRSRSASRDRRYRSSYRQRSNDLRFRHRSRSRSISRRSRDRRRSISRDRSRRKRNDSRSRHRSTSRSRNRASSRSPRRRSRDLRRSRSRDDDKKRRKSSNTSRRQSKERTSSKSNKTELKTSTIDNGNVDSKIATKKPNEVDSTVTPISADNSIKEKTPIAQEVDVNNSVESKHEDNPPPLKRYYRHDLADSEKESLSEEEKVVEKSADDLRFVNICISIIFCLTFVFDSSLVRTNSHQTI